MSDFLQFNTVWNISKWKKGELLLLDVHVDGLARLSVCFKVTSVKKNPAV